MKTSKNIETIVVDANPIISALIKGTAAIKVFWNSDIKEFATTEFTMNEVKSYIPGLAKKAGLMKEVLIFDLALLPLKVYSEDFYKFSLEEAKERIGKRDPKDVDILALTLQLKVPVWTNDKDFEAAGVENYNTASLLKFLE